MEKKIEITWSRKIKTEIKKLRRYYILCRIAILLSVTLTVLFNTHAFAYSEDITTKITCSALAFGSLCFLTWSWFYLEKKNKYYHKKLQNMLKVCQN